MQAVRPQGDGERSGTLSLLGFPVCQHAYKRLLRLGSGRFNRLSTAVHEGAEDCPHDLRYTSKCLHIVLTQARAGPRLFV